MFSFLIQFLGMFLETPRKHVTQSSNSVSLKVRKCCHLINVLQLVLPQYSKNKVFFSFIFAECWNALLSITNRLNFFGVALNDLFLQEDFSKKNLQCSSLRANSVRPRKSVKAYRSRSSICHNVSKVPARLSPSRIQLTAVKLTMAIQQIGRLHNSLLI